MICTNCGAHLMDTDLFCPKCGTKAIKESRCPECGALLRDGTKFCHKCGCPVDGEEQNNEFSGKTLDIPIEAIERNILSETASEISVQKRSAAKSVPPKKQTSAPAAPKKKKPAPAPPQKKKVNYRREEEWEEDDWDDEEEGVDVITIMTVIVGCVLLVVIAVLGYHMYQTYVPKDYDNTAQGPEDGDADIRGQELEEQQSWTSEVSDAYVTIIKNVNVRDNPSTSDSNILKVAQEGETYPYGGSVEGDKWIKIILDDGSVGYVFHEYVTVND